MPARVFLHIVLRCFIVDTGELKPRGLHRTKVGGFSPPIGFPVRLMANISTPIPVGSVRVSAYTVPTDFPESDGTLEWQRTTLVLVETTAAGKSGMGYTYADSATAALIHDTLAEAVTGLDALSPPGAYAAMWRRIRNLGRPGICSMAISAVDCALWDLKARILNVPLVTLLGPLREAAPAYGSGGFTSYSDHQLSEQLSGWVSAG